MNPTQHPSAVRSKKEITETLLDLMCKYTYDEITVKHILIESKISRKTFYRNFKSKSDVLDSYINGIMYQYIETLENINYENFLTIVDVAFQFCDVHRDLLNLLFKDNLIHILLDKWNEFIPRMHRESNNEINSKGNRMTDYIISFNIGAIYNIIVKWIGDGMQLPMQTVRQTVIDYLSDIRNINLRNM